MQGVEFIIAFLHHSGTFGVVESVALISTFNNFIKLLLIDGLEGPVKFVVLGVEGSENGAHSALFVILNKIYNFNNLSRQDRYINKKYLFFTI